MLKILLADDDALIRLTLRATLERHGHRVIEAADATECLERMSADSLDLCVMDAAMCGPALDARLAAARARSLPVLVLSGYAGEVESAGVAVEQKPVGLDAFEAALERLGFGLRSGEAH